MARGPRLTVPALPHHVIQRGNNRQAIFFEPEDYRVFLDCLRVAKHKCRVSLYAYVLMTNHVHLLLEPTQAGDLGRFMQSVGRRYVRYVNDTYRRSGTLWEGRFKSAVVSRDEYLIVCSRYIELNPVRAGMVAHSADYPWSSYQYRALGQPDGLVDEDPWYASLGPDAVARQRTYRAWIDETIGEEEWAQIREATQKGRAIGRAQFQEELGDQVQRRLVGEARGRPSNASSLVRKMYSDPVH